MDFTIFFMVPYLFNTGVSFSLFLS